MQGLRSAADRSVPGDGDRFGTVSQEATAGTTAEPGADEPPIRFLGDELLASVLPGRLDVRVGDQLLTETRGNPLALLELPRGLSPAQLAGGFGLPGALSLEGRVQERFVERLNALAEDSQRLLRVA